MPHAETYMGCENIKLHGAIQRIGKYAFHDCTSLLSIQIPPSTTIIGDHAFAVCRSLKIAYFPFFLPERRARLVWVLVLGSSGFDSQAIVCPKFDYQLWSDFEYVRIKAACLHVKINKIKIAVLQSWHFEPLD